MQSTALSPRNVALAAFAVVVAIGVVVLSVLSMKHEFTRTEELTRAVGLMGVLAAAAGYLVQRKRLQRETPEARALN